MSASVRSSDLLILLQTAGFTAGLRQEGNCEVEQFGGKRAAQRRYETCQRLLDRLVHGDSVETETLWETLEQLLESCGLWRRAWRDALPRVHVLLMELPRVHRFPITSSHGIRPAAKMTATDRTRQLKRLLAGTFRNDLEAQLLLFNFPYP